VRLPAFPFSRPTALPSVHTEHSVLRWMHKIPRPTVSVVTRILVATAGYLPGRCLGAAVYFGVTIRASKL
jgi:hypothetical protein